MRELELMVEYGMKPVEALRSVTSANATVFHLGDKLGFIKSGYLADIIIVDGDPQRDISDLRNIKLVMKNGKIFLK